MNATGWSRGLEVTGGGSGVVSHAGLALLRQLSDRTGLTSGLSAALPSPLGGHDRGRVPDAAERDATIRAELISKLGELIAGTDTLTATKRAELRGKISTMPGLNRFLRVTPGGPLRTDKTKARAEENLDGKYLLRCADPQLSAEDIAAGYKQLLEVERDWRDMKSVLDLRPVYHRLEERIRAHVLLCWLALLLVRVAENATGQTWPVMRRELGRIHLGTFTGPAGTFRRCTELPKPARDLLARLSIDAPRKIHELTTGT